MQTITNFLQQKTNSSPKEQPKKVILNWNNTTIKSMQELRENFNAEELLKAHMNQELFDWLTQHYYETEAKMVAQVPMEDKDYLKKLCQILNLPYSDTLSPEAAAALEGKKIKLRAITSDETIISHAANAAFDQEELASLLNQGQTSIYLCENTFSIPLSKSDVEYTGVGNVIIENAFTQAQYQKAGIKIQNINLPADTSDSMMKIAQEAALNNGYDDFADTHSTLTAFLHGKLQSCKRPHTYYHLPYNASTGAKYFTSKYECENTRDKIIEKAYHEAETYFDPDSSRCLAKEAAGFYSGRINNVFSPILEQLGVLCTICEKKDTFTKISGLISHAEKNLRTKFEDEINSNEDYYAMYDLEYFRNQTDIEEHDYRFSEGAVSRFIEKMVSDSVQYTTNGLYTSIQEMEKDLNDHAAAFFNAAYSEYLNYVSEIDNLMEEIGRKLPELHKNESIQDYLERVCVAQRV